jgi:hypothetical protein
MLKLKKIRLESQRVIKYYGKEYRTGLNIIEKLLK